MQLASAPLGRAGQLEGARHRLGDQAGLDARRSEVAVVAAGKDDRTEGAQRGVGQGRDDHLGRVCGRGHKARVLQAGIDPGREAREVQGGGGRSGAPGAAAGSAIQPQGDKHRATRRVGSERGHAHGRRRSQRLDPIGQAASSPAAQGGQAVLQLLSRPQCCGRRNTLLAPGLFERRGFARGFQLQRFDQGVPP